MVLLTALAGNSQWLDGGAMFGNAPRALWENWAQVDQKHRIKLSCRSLLIEDQDVKILCEVGIGAFFPPHLAERYGVQPLHHMLLESLHQNGLNDSDISYIILSHLHFDHAGGLLPDYQSRLKSGERLLFPKAKYVVSRRAWERAIKPHPRDQASFIPELIDMLKMSNRLIILDDEEKIPGLERFSFFETQGHTPGHLHTLYRGDNRSVVFAGDLIPGVPWIHLPITMGYDRYAELVIDEKENFYKRSLKEQWLVFFTHDPKYAMASLIKDEKGKYKTNAEEIWEEKDLVKFQL